MNIKHFGQHGFTTIGQGPRVLCHYELWHLSSRSCGKVQVGRSVHIKNPSTAFFKPRIDDLLSKELLGKWFTLTLMIEEWTTRFKVTQDKQKSLQWLLRLNLIMQQG